jgi:hypothetical protein
VGVQIYLLDRRTVTLLVGNDPQKIGTLRRSWKVTEIDSERAAEIEAARANIAAEGAPVAVMVADVAEIPLAIEPSRPVAAHLVIGWDADRSSVTDFGWDYLPALGYAVRGTSSAEYALHEERAGVLHPVTTSRAIELGILDDAGKFQRRGQPSITKCRSVRPYISSYAQADCTLSNGQTAEILTSVESGTLPDSTWYVGKRPADVARYTAGESGAGEGAG